MSAADPQSTDEYNLVMHEKISALGSIPNTSDLYSVQSTNILRRQLLELLGSNGAQRSYIFRPGAVGALPYGVYNDWVKLYTDAVKAPGPITIYLDNSLLGGLPIDIPAGNWDFPRWDVTLAGANGFAFVQVALGLDTTLNGVVSMTGFLDISQNNQLSPVITIPPPTPNGAPLVIVLDRGVAIHSNAQPFIEVPSDRFLAIALLNNATLDIWSINLSDGTLGVTSLILVCQDSAVVSGDAIRSNGVNTLAFFQFFSASKLVDFTFQPNFLGTILTDIIDIASNIQYVESNIANWSGTSPGTIANALDRIAAVIGPIP